MRVQYKSTFSRELCEPWGGTGHESERTRGGDVGMSDERTVALERQNAALRERLAMQERLMDEYDVHYHAWPLPVVHPLGYYYTHPYRPWPALVGVNVLGLGVGVAERRPAEAAAPSEDVICAALAPSAAERQRMRETYGGYMGLVREESA